jgi:hypothetical protein
LTFFISFIQCLTIRILKMMAKPTHNSVQKVGFSFLWLSWIAVAFSLVYIILHIQWIPFDVLYLFYPVECTLFLLCAFIYGSFLDLLSITVFKLVKSYKIVRYRRLFVIITIFTCTALICNFVFLLSLS